MEAEHVQSASIAYYELKWLGARETAKLPGRV